MNLPPSENRHRRDDLIVVATLVALLTLLFADVIFFGRCFYRADLTAYEYPLKRILHLLVAQGHSPYWNPYYSGGQPLAANPAWELFYPPQWLIFFPDFNLAYRLHIVLHFYLAALGMYWLLRSLDLRPLAAIAGAFAFALGGPLMSQTMRLPFLFSMSWIPLILLFARRFYLRPNRRDFALTALLTTMQVLIGEPTTFAQTSILVAAYGLYRAAGEDERIRQSLRNVCWALLIALTALVAGSVQMIPGLDFVRDTVRKQNLSFAAVSSWSMPWYRPLEMIYPAVFRYIRASDGDEQITRLYSDRDEPFIADLYTGCLFGGLLLLTPFVKRRGRPLVLALVGGSLLVAAGSHTPLLRLLYDSGIFRSIRYPEKFFLIAIVTAILWGSVLLNDLLDGDRELRRALVRITVVLMIIGAIMAITLPLPPPSAADVRAPIEPRLFDFTQPRYYWVLNLLRGSIMLALFAPRKVKDSAARRAALMIFLTADLLYLHPRLAPRMPASFFDEPRVVTSISATSPAAPVRVFHEADWQWILRDPAAEKWFADPHTYWWMFRNGAFPRNLSGWGVETVLDHDIDETTLTNSAAFMHAAVRLHKLLPGSDWREPILAMSNAGYVTAFNPLPSDPTRLRAQPHDISPIHFVPVEPTPRYYFASRILSAANEDEFVSRITAGWTRGTAIVPFTSFAPAGGVVESHREQPGHIQLRVRTSGESFLVISVTAHRYWKALVDGQPAELVPANLAYQGLRLSAGNHDISLTYRNPLIVPAAAISIGMITLLLILASGYRRESV